MRYRFGDSELDTDTVALRVAGQSVAVEPQVFAVLRFLIEQRHRAVTKEELLDSVWGHRFVTESALTSRVKTARRLVGDDGRAQHVIRTVHGTGYQFVAPVVEVAAAARAAPGTPPVTAGRPGDLPVPPTPTIGREADIAAVLEELEHSRLVTLVGPGGVGKTRVATEAARRLPTTVDVAFVDLTVTRDPDLVLPLVAEQLGVQVRDDTAASLGEALRGRSTTLVLDNVEHVISAAPAIGDLVARVPDLRVLATSRERLRLAGEQLLDLAPLPIDAGGAIALFERAARTVDPTFDLAAHRDDVVAICAAVDGLPLALELAAGNVRLPPPELLRARLGSRLAADDGRRDAPARHRTMAATIDWSLQLLAPSDLALFRRLGTFAGPANLASVERVCAGPPVDDVLTALGRLLDQSLLRRIDRDNEPRFTMLELLRQRAVVLLAESDEREQVAARHRADVLDRLRAIDAERWAARAGSWIEDTTALLPEIRAAFATAHAAGERRTVAEIVGLLGTFWHREGHHREARVWLELALEHPDAGDIERTSRVHLSAGFLAWARSDTATTRLHWEAAIDGFGSIGDDRMLAYALSLVGGTFIGDPERYREGLARTQEGLAMARRVGERPLIAQALNVQGELARVAGDDDLAEVSYREGLDHANACGDRAHQSVFIANLAYLASHRGELIEAVRLAQDALGRCWSIGRTMMAAWTVGELAQPLAGLGEPERAATLLGASDHALTVLGVGRHPGDVPEVETTRTLLRDLLGEERFRELLAAGAQVPLADAVALALAFTPAVAGDDQDVRSS